MKYKLIGSMALGFLIWSSGMPSAVAQNPANAANDTRYLALGDSLAFGFNPFIDPPDDAKYLGYPLMVSLVVHRKVANASCPGETSTSFITGTGALPGFICGAIPQATVFTAAGVPVMVPIQLFVPYGVARSQLDYAVNYLKANPNPELVTINIGGNDLAPLLTCTGAGCQALATTLLTQLGQNLGFIYSALRGAGYEGPIVAANYYAFNYNDPLEVGPTGAFTALNATIASVSALPQFRVKVADVYTAFQEASGPSGDPCRAGLLLKVPNSTSCDTHPSLLGQALMAGAVVLEADIK